MINTLQDPNSIRNILTFITDNFSPNRCDINNHNDKLSCNYFEYLDTNISIGFLEDVTLIQNEPIDFSFCIDIFKISFSTIFTKQENTNFSFCIPNAAYISSYRQPIQYKANGEDFILIKDEEFTLQFPIHDANFYGVSVLSDKSFIEAGSTIDDIDIILGNTSFKIKGNIKSVTQRDDSKWNTDIEISHLNNLEGEKYINYICNRFSADIYGESYRRIDFASKLYDNTSSTQFSEAFSRRNSLLSELSEAFNSSLPNSIGIINHKHQKLQSAVQIKRIYDNTYYFQRIINVPGLHIYNKNKVLIYNQFYGFLSNINEFKYLLSYIDRDIDWHSHFLIDFKKHYSEQSGINFESLYFIDINNHPSILNTRQKDCEIKCTPIENNEAFQNFIYKNLDNLFCKAIGSNKDFFDISQNKKYLPKRRIFKIEHNKTVQGYALCEAFEKKQISHDMLNACHLFVNSNSTGFDEIINSILPHLAKFYSENQCTKFRIILHIHEGKIAPLSLDHILYQGKLIRLTLSKDGLYFLNQYCTFFHQTQFSPIHPLTYPQQSLYIIDKLHPETSINTISARWKIFDTLDISSLEKALNEMIRSNDAMRTQIVREKNYTGQIFKEITYQKFVFVDFSLPDSPSIEQYENEFSKYRFTLYNSDLYEFVIYKLSDKECGVFCRMHHLIADGWSYGQFLIQLTEYYAFYKYQRQLSSTNKLSYTHFIEKDYDYLFSKRYERDKKFWHDSLKEYDGTTIFSERYTHNITTQSKRKIYYVKNELTKKVNTYCKDNKISSFSFLLSVLFMYLHKLSQQKHVSIGTTVLNRSGAEERKAIGTCVTSIPIVMQFEKDTPFSELVKQVTAKFRRSMKHQRYPFEILMRELKTQNVDIDSIYNVTFTYHNNKANTISGIPFKFYPVWYPYHHQAEPLNIHFHDFFSEDAFDLYYDYRLAFFKEPHIEQIHSTILFILQQIVNNPNIKLQDISILLESEKYLIINAFNKTEMEYPRDKTLHELIEIQTKVSPNKIAVSDDSESVTYYELNKRANKIAHLIHSKKDLLHGDFVGIFIDNSINQIVAQIAVLKAGYAYIPFDINIPYKRIQSIINDSKMSCLLTVEQFNNQCNRLLWESTTLKMAIVLDSDNIHTPEDHSKQYVMDKNLWNHIAENAKNQIEGGGWNNSYDGKPFTKVEMDEYGDNVLTKLKPFLYNEAKVLEIGCATGITMYRIAPWVKNYHGTDLSDVTIDKNKKYIREEKIENITLDVYAAHEISAITNEKYDIIIINSVIQSFPGFNYLRDVLLKATTLLNDEGILFLGDLMDLDLKEKLLESISSFKKRHNIPFHQINESNELYVSRAYLENFVLETPHIDKLEFSNKHHTVKNELTEFRFDAILHINKKIPPKKHNLSKSKYHLGLESFINNRTTNLCLTLDSSSLAYAIYTSGTTGKPKGVMIEHKSVVSFCYWFISYYKFQETDKQARFINFSFDPAVVDVFPALIGGISIHIIPNEVKSSFDLLNDYLNKNNITLMNTPTPIGEILQKYPNKSLRYLSTGGDKLALYKKNKFKLINSYGPTECTIVSTVYDVSEQSKNIPIGKPIANTKIYILDNQNSMLPIGATGELCISGDCVARGYINNNKNDKFIDNPFEPGKKLYKSGDLARWLYDGNIEIVGRKDSQVKLRGFRIELKEIEAVLKQHEDVTNAVVLLNDSANPGKYLSAYYETQNKTSKEELLTHLKKALPYYMIPSHLIQLDKIPLMSTGKIDIQKLKAFQDKLHIESNDIFQPPKTKTEKTIAKIWKNILQKRHISVNDNFFEHGGDSLKVMAVCSELSMKNIFISVQNLFDYPTIISLSSFIDNGHIKSNNDAIVHSAVRKNKDDISKISVGSSRRTFENVLITGATGYLGIHLVYEIIQKTDAHIFCLIRGENIDAIKEKFKRVILHFFDEAFLDTYSDRISLLKGNISDSHLGLNENDYLNLAKEIDTIIHSAAIVKFYGHYNEFEKINVGGIKNVVQLAKKSGAYVCHMSTMSVAGGIDVMLDKPHADFSENDLFIGQHYKDNSYIRSKFEAENFLINEINNGFDASIFRLGMITERWCDGIFQINPSDNYFHNVLNAIIQIKAIPENTLHFEIDFSPVDLCSASIFELMAAKDCKGKIFHIYNDKKLSLGELINKLNEYGKDIQVLSPMPFKSFLKYIRENCDVRKEVIEKIASDFNYDILMNESYKPELKSNITQKYLSQLNFSWPKIDQKYINQMIDYLTDIQFLD